MWEVQNTEPPQFTYSLGGNQENSVVLISLLPIFYSRPFPTFYTLLHLHMSPQIHHLYFKSISNSPLIYLLYFIQTWSYPEKNGYSWRYMVEYAENYFVLLYCQHYCR
jgi:hypothetical protein